MNAGSLTWRVFHTLPQAEGRVAQALREAGHEVLFLRCWEEVRHARATVRELRPYFPRYVFATGALPEPVRRAARLVLFGDRPVAVPLAVIGELRARGDSEGLVALTKSEKRARRLARGARVRIEAGPFEGLIGNVLRDNGKFTTLWLDSLRVDVKSAHLEAGV